MEIYLDNSATTRVCTAACNAAVSAMRDCYGNPSSLHHMGFQAEKLMDTARSQIARALGCLGEELVFTSGATESNNLAVTGLTAAYPRAGKKIVTTAIEHPSVLEPCRRMEEAGYTVVRLPLDENGRSRRKPLAPQLTQIRRWSALCWSTTKSELCWTHSGFAESSSRKARGR